MNSLSILLFCFLLGCFTVEVKSRMKPALFFNPITKQLEELNDNHKKCTICLPACPAASRTQQLLNIKVSKSGNSIFLQYVERVFFQDEQGSEVEPNVCDFPYKPAMVENTASQNSYETGYEFFYQENMPVELQCKKYDQFKKVSFTEEVDSIPKQSVFSPPPVIRIDDVNNTKFRVRLEDDIWKYFWIPVLSIQIDRRHQRQISFTKDLINDHHDLDKTMLMCEDYNLGDQSQVVPSRKWQKYQEMLETQQLFDSDDIDHPESSNDHVDQEKATDEGDMEEVQIMPMRYFHTLSARLATCTFFNVASIWNTVTEQYNLVDSYLYEIYRKQPTKINIIFGTKGLSEEANFDHFSKTNPPGNPILQKFPIPMPKLLYRILEYKKDDGQILNAIFIIHNLLHSDSIPVGDRVCTSESEVKVWDTLKIQRKDQENKPDLVYVCPVTRQTIQNLRANYEVSENMQPLQLNSFLMIL